MLVLSGPRPWADPSSIGAFAAAAGMPGDAGIVGVAAGFAVWHS
jgi:hypothetical protein